MIINTGSRTDIPAFYSEWIFNRLKAGFVYVRNPYFPKLVHSYRLDPEVVDLLSFCSKNPGPMLPRLDELSAYECFFFISITPYGKRIEPNVPDKNVVIDSTIALANHLGPNRVAWRYDPIFIDKTYTEEYHLRAFRKIASALSGHIAFCVISFIDLYEKTKRNFPGVNEVERETQLRLGEKLAKIASEYGIKIYSCLENPELSRFGIDTSGCFSKEVAEKALGYKLIVPPAKKGARQGCSCLLGNDIGAYNSCPHGCLYCYANYDKSLVMENFAKHDQNSPLLIGHLEEGDKVVEAKQISYKSKQVSLF